MSVGLVPIASRIRGSKEIINNNVNGFLFKSKSQEELKLSIKKAMSLNDEEYKKISYNSFKSEKSMMKKLSK